jgi:hypothetical protein
MASAPTTCYADEPSALAAPSCRHCQAGEESLIRRQLHVSRDGLIRRWKVSCNNCGRYSYLPHGQILKRKPSSAKLEPDRPPCPSCASTDVWRHSARRWSCRWCRHWFVSEPKLRSDNTSGHSGISAFEGKWLVRIQIPGKRLTVGEYETLELAEQALAAAKLQFAEPAAPVVPNCSEDAHKPDDAAEEAAALVKLVEQGDCNPREIRELIGYSDAERRCLEFLASQGMLASAQVTAVLSFRDRVMEQFNHLIDSEVYVMAESQAEQETVQP